MDTQLQTPSTRTSPVSAEGCAGCRKLEAELEDARHEVLEVREQMQELQEMKHISHKLVVALYERLRRRHRQLAELRAVAEGAS